MYSCEGGGLRVFGGFRAGWIGYRGGGWRWGVLKTRLFILGSGGGEKPMWEAVNPGDQTISPKCEP